MARESLGVGSQYSGSSSPDPLQSSPGAISLRNQSPVRRSSSPTKLMSTKSIKLHDVTIQTPPRHGAGRQSSNARSAGTYITSQQLPEGTSPWRIRVTVEAEPGSEGDEHPILNFNQRMETKTVKIPLRGSDGDGAEEPRPATGRRGRGRNTPSTSPAKGRKRSATPARARGGSRGRRLTDLDVTVLGDDSDDPDANPRRRKPRAKKSPKKQQEKQASDTNLESNAETGEVSTDISSARSRRQTQANRSFSIAEDPDTMDEGILHPSFDEEESPNLRRLDPNRVSIRSRPQTAQSKETELKEPEGSRKNDQLPPLQINGLQLNGEDLQLARTRTYPTPELSPNLADHEIQPFASTAEPSTSQDPTNVHQEFDSILESEGFTMISLDSIPSARQFLSSPPVIDQSHQPSPVSTASKNVSARSQNKLLRTSSAARESPIPAAARRVSMLTTSRLNEDDSEISSTMPSSPPSGLQVPVVPGPKPLTRERTPLPSPSSSPKLPSPPRAAVHPPALNVEEKPTPPRLARVIRAGIALQGVLSPKFGSMRAKSPLSRTFMSGETLSPRPKENMDNLFAGCDVGTRRELRAGFRLGEELAKRRVMSSSPALESIGNKSSLAEPRTPVRTLQLPPGPETMQAQRERQWQLERDAISRQIQMANTSQVIVIDSDDESAIPPSTSKANDEPEDEESDGEDIWLQEAHNSSQHSDSAGPSSAADLRPPRRRAIPSPWKRGEEVEQSTMISNSDMSGIFWQNSRRRGSNVNIPEAKSPERTYDLAKILGVQQSQQNVTFEKSPVKDTEYGTVRQNHVHPEPESDVSMMSKESMDQDEHQDDGMWTGEETIIPEEHDGTGSLTNGDDIMDDEHSVEQEEDEYGDQSRTQSVQRSFVEGDTHPSFSTEEASLIPPMKIPVNFGDESSLSRDLTAHTVTTNESISTAEHSSIGNSTADQSATSLSSVGHSNVEHSANGQSTVDHSAIEQSATEFSSIGHSTSEYPTAALWSDDHSSFNNSTNMNSTMNQTNINESSLVSQQYTSSHGAWLDRIGSIASAWTGRKQEKEEKEAKEEIAEPVVDTSSTTKIPKNAPVLSSSPAPVAEEYSEYTSSEPTTFSSRHHRLNSQRLSTSSTSSPASNSRQASKSSSKPSTSSSSSSQPPLSASGPWTSQHYRALHRVYLKALRRSQDKYKPSDLRPGLQQLLGQTIKSGSGRHDVKVELNAKELGVVEEFFRDLEKGGPSTAADANKVQVEFSVEDVALRLYSIVVGYKERGIEPNVKA